MYFFQLVQALKHQNYYSNPLCEFLLKRALNNRRLGQKVLFSNLNYLFYDFFLAFLDLKVWNYFWSIFMEDCLPFGILSISKSKKICAIRIYFTLQAAPEHIEILQSQTQFLQRLNSINDTLILHDTKSADFTRRNEIFLDNLKEFI